MKLDNGYQEILRALGTFIDAHRFLNVRIIEIDDGIVVQGHTAPGDDGAPSRFETFLLTDEDLRLMVGAAQRSAASQAERTIDANQ